MDFTLDENVPVSVCNVLEEAGHTVQFIKNYTPPGAKDEIVATVSERLEAVLISFDGDFEKIAPTAFPKAVQDMASMLRTPSRQAARGGSISNRV